ncbi:response regulator [Paenibacillus sp. YIM B09110]|uniref:response regulator n=1 Tax=Paenibacillus sp. YIM B09110 TaxID=3126102 RepID=UPI00301E2125
MLELPIRVLIVDDEYLVRDLLKYCVDWSALGYQIIGEAEEATGALEIMDKLLPDVVITDIRMPQTDGLELSVLIKKQYPNTKVLILSGHGEFHYAKKAIEAGVDHYLLKPINDEELTEVLGKLADKIWQENGVRQRMSQSLEAEREAMLLRLIQGQLNLNEMNRMEQEWFKDSTRYCISVVESEARHDEDWQLSRYWYNAIEDADGAYAVLDTSGKVIILSSNENLDMNHILRLSPDKERWNLGIGTWKNRFGSISESYREALIALNYKMVTGTGIAIAYSERKQFLKQPAGSYSSETLDFALHAKLADGIVEQIEAVLFRIDLDQKEAMHKVQMEAVRLETHIRSKLATKVDPRDSAIHNMRSLQMIMDYLKEIVRALLPDDTTKELNNSQLVQKVQRHLERHYADPELSLTTVANTFYINPSYLSRMFKSGTGSSFVEYITKLRMERAEQLLMRTEMKIYEVANDVGYNDAHYFGICFKKYKGMSVNEYRKNINH